MNLVIVESPAKAHTIKKFLGPQFKVIASYGHIRDLPKSELGVDIEHNFSPKYIIPLKARKNVNTLKKEIAKAKELYLATDLDREGEAIAWHILQACGLENQNLNPKNQDQKFQVFSIKRITFSEITESAIKEAIKNPRAINMNLVDAQQARRILDRLVGYKLSPLLWEKVKRGLSAGRVQSVALRLIVEREKEIESFKPQEYWQIQALLETKDQKEKFRAKLVEKDGQKLEKFSLQNEEQALKIVEALKKADFQVQEVIKKERVKNPPPPFITSTLQQAASKVLGFSARKTMLLAQQLYEGVPLGKEGPTGLITYMRTDSLHLAKQFIDQSVEFIKKNFGPQYAQEGGRTFKSKKTAQEAHEAIRPTYIEKTPQSLKEFLKPDQFKLYSLIYYQALASQMTEAVFEITQIKIKAKNYGFLASGSKIKFDGFLKALPNKEREVILPPLKEGEFLKLVKLEPIQAFTEPPARYTEGSLVKTLEENGVGRPSTYAPIMSTLLERGYIEKERGFLKPREIGYIVNNLLVSHFPAIVDVKFTAYIEEELDQIAQGKIGWVKVVENFYKPFSRELELKYQKIEKIQIPLKETDQVCEKCGQKMVIREGKYGEFLACLGFPECKNTKPITKEIQVKCPYCGGKILEKKSRKGKTFYGCENYPNCQFASWDEPINQRCSQCDGLMTQKGNILTCLRCKNKEILKS